jgi:hypothetical protein
VLNSETRRRFALYTDASPTELRVPMSLPPVPTIDDNMAALQHFALGSFGQSKMLTGHIR